MKIKIREEHKAAMTKLGEDIVVARVAFERASVKLKQRQEALWKAVRKAYPELEGFILAFDFKKMELSITGRLEQGERGKNE